MTTKQDMQIANQGTLFLHDLKEFLGFLRSLWGILGSISVFFPLSNALLRVLPLGKWEQGGGGFTYTSGALATSLATLAAIFVILLTFGQRHAAAHDRGRGDMRDQATLFAILAVGAIALYLALAYLAQATLNSIEPPVIPGLLVLWDLGLLFTYASFWSLTTWAFMLLAMTEFFVNTSLARTSESDQAVATQGSPPLDQPWSTSRIRTRPRHDAITWPRPLAQPDVPKTHPGEAEYGEALTEIVTGSPERLALFVSVGTADFLAQWIASLYNNHRPPIDRLVIKSLSKELVLQLSALGMLQYGFNRTLETNISRIRQTVELHGTEVECRHWKALPPFHGYLYGDRLLVNSWAVDKEGHLHVRTPLTEMTHTDYPAEYEFARRAFESG